jgi:hypothetical protein
MTATHGFELNREAYYPPKVVNSSAAQDRGAPDEVYLSIPRPKDYRVEERSTQFWAGTAHVKGNSDRNSRQSERESAFRSSTNNLDRFVTLQMRPVNQIRMRRLKVLGAEIQRGQRKLLAPPSRIERTG